MEYAQENIARINEKLDRLLTQSPPEKITSGRRMVAASAGKINAILKKGWPIEAVLEALAEGGFTMTEKTLRTYLQRSAKEDRAGFDISVWLDHPDGYRKEERTPNWYKGRVTK